MKLCISIFLFLLLYFLFSSTIKSQVRIGDLIPPRKGTLLDLKAENIDIGNSSYIGGLLLPHAKITDLNKMPDSFGLGNPSTDVLLALTGMIIYNSEVSSGGIAKGVYTWDGEKWNLLLKPVVSIK